MKVKIPVVAYYSDGGDGSGTFNVYNNVEELQKDRCAKFNTTEINEHNRNHR